MCDNRHYISEAPLSLNSVRKRIENFLSSNGLRFAALDRYVIISRDEDGDEIIAGGGLDGNVIKCVAVSEAARGENLMNILVSRLISIAHEEGHESVKAFTKPSNEDIFRSLGFNLLASSGKAVLMENGRGGLPEYRKYLKSLSRPGRNGAVVMNANPFTEGHRYLIRQAASQVDNLYVIVVKEDRSRFPYSERKAMIEAGCAGLENVIVCEGSDYAVSAATFPTYFLKQLDESTPAHIELDLDLFVKHIAQPLGVTVRFAGSEPDDDLTRCYNKMMSEILPASRNPISFVEIPRLEQSGKPVSATSLRNALDRGDLKSAIRLVPVSTVPYMIADLAERALRMELETTPKPGLVDKLDNGAHKDMDYALMSASISALRPYLTRIAVRSAKDIDAAEIKAAGIEAEEAMLEATGGVNTHRGALFCMGLAVAAASFLACNEGQVAAAPFRELISRIASGIPSAGSTHGAEAKRNFKVGGALENARMAYPELFSAWLPYFRSLAGDQYRCHKTLLYIMTSLDDTNVLHRRGAEGLAYAKSEAAGLLGNFSIGGLSSMNADFIRENISPGGSADMLSLTIFIDHVIINN
jgi:hypothetical protein